MALLRASLGQDASYISTSPSSRRPGQLLDTAEVPGHADGAAYAVEGKYALQENRVLNRVLFCLIVYTGLFNVPDATASPKSLYQSLFDQILQFVGSDPIAHP